MTPFEIVLVALLGAAVTLPHLVKRKEVPQDYFELERKLKSMGLELENVYDQLIKWNKKSAARAAREEQPQEPAAGGFNGFIAQREAIRSQLRERIRRH